MRGPFNEWLGLTFVEASADEVVATITIRPALHQPYGLVHGGVYASVIEAVCSTGAAIAAGARGYTAVGAENNTCFLKAVREGTLTVVARPLSNGRRTQVWTADIRDERGALIAQGRVRTIGIEPGAALAGQLVEVK
ncbi:MAG: PaaI family thioesterase [Deltaproteobacteria bacterium]|nr:PaaI family thioesterase [Deltaproteobacteria bacterium]